MADPTKYQRSYSFTNYQASSPADPLPGTQVDNELENIEASIEQTVEALKDIRRSDGALKNNIVTRDALDAELSAELGEGSLDNREAAEAAAEAAEAAQELAEAAAVAAEAYVTAREATSTTSLAVGTGTKVFTTQSGKQFSAGAPVTICDVAAPTVNVMYGTVVSYTGTTLTTSVGSFIGSGTLADWTIAVTGARGATGAQGTPGAGTGDLLAANNLSDLGNAATARGNLGLGALAVEDDVTFALIAGAAVASSGDATTGTASDKLMTPERTEEQIAGKIHTYTKPQRGDVVDVAYGATVTLDLATGNNFRIGSLTGNITLANPTNQAEGQSGLIFLTQDGTGSRSITYGTNWLFPNNGTEPPLTTNASAKDVIYYFVESSGNIICNLSKRHA